MMIHGNSYANLEENLKKDNQKIPENVIHL